MKLFDINVLIYAHREDQQHHDFYRTAMESSINSGESFALSSLAAAGFVRIVTHSRFPNGPTPQAQALAVIDALAGLDHCHWVGPGSRHWELMSNLCRVCKCAGKQVADAQHAAVAIEHACEWVTRDHNFNAFVPHGLSLNLLEP